MNDTLKEGIALFESYKLDEAQQIFELLVERDIENMEAQLFLGKIYTRKQKYGDAINCFNQILEKNPEHSEAKTGLTLISGILKLTNNFYFENSYTDDDLYELPNNFTNR